MLLTPYIQNVLKQKGLTIQILCNFLSLLTDAQFIVGHLNTQARKFKKYNNNIKIHY